MESYKCSLATQVTTFTGDEVRDCVLEKTETMSREDTTHGARAPAAPAVVYAGIVGQLEAFDPRSDSISAYIERAEMFLDANNVPEEKRVATFLNGES